MRISKNYLKNKANSSVRSHVILSDTARLEQPNYLIMNKQRLVIIGSGKVATQLGRAWSQRGHQVLAVISRKAQNAQRLADEVGAQATTDWQTLPTDADWYIIAVSDAAIATVAAALQPVLPVSARVLHTSGATDSAILAPHFAHYGVLYPLQTFTLAAAVDWPTVPMCLYASFDEWQADLLDLAQSLSPQVHWLDDRARAGLHVAAVFANNFINHAVNLSQKILDEENISLELIQPLLQRTFDQILAGQAPTSQTGPAVRNDATTLARHESYLGAQPYALAIYRAMTASIQAHHSTKTDAET